MTKNCRSAFTNYLRKNEIKYTTFPGYVSIGYYHFFFNNQFDYITITHTEAKGISITFPYADPGRIMQRYQGYRNWIKPYITPKTPLLPGMAINRSGRLQPIK